MVTATKTKTEPTNSINNNGGGDEGAPPSSRKREGFTAQLESAGGAWAACTQGYR